MAATSNPYGLKIVGHMGGDLPGGGELRWVKMTTNVARIITKGDILTLNAGQPDRATATPTTTRSSSTPSGIVSEFYYTDTNSTPARKYNTTIPSGAVTSYGTIYVGYVDSPWVIMQVQADGAVDQTKLGFNIALKNFSATTALTSKIQADSATAAVTATLACRIIGVVDPVGGAVGSGWADAYPDLIVIWNAGVHSLMNATGL